LLVDRVKCEESNADNVQKAVWSTPQPLLPILCHLDIEKIKGQCAPVWDFLKFAIVKIVWFYVTHVTGP